MHQQVLPFSRFGAELSFVEVDIQSIGEGLSSEFLIHRSGFFVGVNPHPAEIVSKGRLQLLAELWCKRLSASRSTPQSIRE